MGVSQRSLDVQGIRTVGEVQLDRDHLVSQLQKTVALSLMIQDLQKLGLAVRDGSQSHVLDGSPDPRVIPPVHPTVRAVPVGVRDQQRGRGPVAVVGAAIAVGTGAPDVLEIPYLPNSADVVVGDLLTSSGLGGRFPRDYPVARITQVTVNPTQSYATVIAEPIALLERSREVLLVWPSDKILQPVDTQAMESNDATGEKPESANSTNATKNTNSATDTGTVNSGAQ